MTKREKEYYSNQVTEIRKRIETGQCRFGDHRLLKDYLTILNGK